METFPELTTTTEDERKICALQSGFAARLRTSRYFLVEVSKMDGVFLVFGFWFLVWSLDGANFFGCGVDRASTIFGQV